MALMEVLVAAAILGLAAIAFLSLLRDAGADAAHARRQAQTAALALSLLEDAKTQWRTGPHAGRLAGRVWTRACGLSSDHRGQRMALVACEVTIFPQEGPPFRLQSAFVIAAEDLRRP